MAVRMPYLCGLSGIRVNFISSLHASCKNRKNLAHQPWTVVHAGDRDDVIILEGPAEIVEDRSELERVESLYRLKYVDPGSGAQAAIFAPEADLYRVSVRRVMAWEYSTVANHTDWEFE